MPVSQGTRRMPLAVFAAVCFAAVELARLIDDPTVLGSFPAFWPLAGVLAGVLITSPPRAWLPPVLTACAAMLLSALLHGGRLLPTAVAAIIFGIQSTAIAWTIRRSIGGQPFALDRLPHAFALVGVGTLVTLAGGLLAGLILMPWGPAVLSVWRTWWLADTIGLVVMAPLVLGAMTAAPLTAETFRASRGIELVLALVAGLVVTEGIFGGWFHPTLQVPAYILPFLLWAVFRFGPGASGAAALIVGGLALWHSARGEGPLAIFTAADIVLRAQGGIAITGSSLLLLASIVAERKRVARERDALVAELQQALAEIKTLRGFIPICAWCHKVRDDAGFWQQLEQYLDEKTDATFSHSICPICTEAARREIEAHVAERVS